MAYPLGLSITNPGAESGDATGWTNSLGTLQASTGWAPGGEAPRTGSYLFYAGAYARTAAYQDVALPGAQEADVDAEDLQIELSAWQSGNDVDEDSGAIAITFLDGAGDELGTCSTTFISPSLTWTERLLRSTVPAGTRTFRLWLWGIRTAGAGLDAYWDDITATLIDASSSVTYPTNIPIINPGADTGDTTGWTDDVAALAVQAGTYETPRSRGYFFVSTKNGATSQSHQDIGIPACMEADADTGYLSAELTCMQSGYVSDNDAARQELESFDDSMNSLGSDANSDEEYDRLWTAREVEHSVPEDTRTLRISLYGTRAAGTWCDAYLEDFNLTVDKEDPPAYTGAGVLVIAAVLLAGTGVYTPPVYAGDGGVTLAPVELVGTGTYVPPDYAGGGGITFAPVGLAGTGIYTPPDYAGDGGLLLAPVGLEGTGIFAPPIYTGDGGLALAPITFSGAGLHSLVYNGAGRLRLAAVRMGGAGIFEPPPDCLPLEVVTDWTGTGGVASTLPLVDTSGGGGGGLGSGVVFPLVDTGGE